MLAFLITGLIKLSAPWAIATAEFALQDDTLIEEAKTLYPNLDLDSGALTANTERLRSEEAIQSVFEQLPPGHVRMLVESGDTWIVRTKERLRGWACAGDIIQWSIKGRDLCSWLDGNDEPKATVKQLDIVRERLSLARSEDGQLHSIGFRSAHRDLSLAIVTAFGDLLIAKQEEAKLTLRRKINDWIEAERTTIPQRPQEEVKRRNEKENDVGDSQAEIRLFRKVAKAMETADDDLSRLETLRRNEAIQTESTAPGIGTDPSFDKAIDRKIAETEQDRIALNQELARMTTAFKNEEWQGYRDLLPAPPPPEQAAQSAQGAYAALTKSEYSFLIHPEWAKPAAVLRRPASASGLTTLMAAAIATLLALSISALLALLEAAFHNRFKQPVDVAEASLYANPHWPSVRPPQQSDLKSVG